MGSAQATDEDLMRALYDAHAGVLLGYVRRLVGGDTARAEDVVQETLLRAWLITVARHLVIDGERARKARPPEVPHLLTDPGGGQDRQRAGDEMLDRILLAHGLTDALGTLSAEHRAVLQELYFADRSVVDAARVLGIPAGTVKSRAYYALRSLRIACEERGIVP